MTNDNMPAPAIPPMPPAQKNRSWLKWGAVGVGALFVFSLLSDDSSDSTPAPPPVVTQAPPTTQATTTAPTTTVRVASDSDRQLMILRAIDIEGTIRNDVCPGFRNLLRQGFTRIDLIDLAIEAFEEGFGERLLPASRELFRKHLNDC